MTRYQNGRIPLNELVEFDTGNGKHWGTPTTRARWYAGRAAIKRRTGVTLYISAGWNAYRPYAEQVIGRNEACRQGNCNAAASPGYSSHGGTWISAKYTKRQWVDAMALDIGNYWAVPWSIFKEEMERVGFLVGAITPELAGIFEPWHVIDLAPYASFAGDDSKPFPDEKEIEVIAYPTKEDATARQSGRTVAPGGTFYLNTKTGQGTSKASNIVGGVGAYTFVEHVYAEGTPGDGLEVVLFWDDLATGGPHSGHFTQRVTLDPNGVLRENIPFQHTVVAGPKGTAVYARIQALPTNKGNIKVTRFASDAFLYKV